MSDQYVGEIRVLSGTGQSRKAVRSHRRGLDQDAKVAPSRFGHERLRAEARRGNESPGVVSGGWQPAARPYSATPAPALQHRAGRGLSA